LRLTSPRIVPSASIAVTSALTFAPVFLFMSSISPPSYPDIVGRAVAGTIAEA
jgi:hypothetical protein